MSEQILSAVHGVTTMLFGIYCSAFFLGIKPIRKNILTMFLLFSGQGLLYVIDLALFGETLANMSYPLIVHFPLVLFLSVHYKYPLISSAVSVFSAYLCCQISNWTGLFALAITGLQWCYYSVRILTTTLTFVLLYRYVFRSTKTIFTKNARELSIIGFLPFVYYVFDYASTKFSTLLYSGNKAVVEFMGFAFCIAYLVFLIIYFQEYENKQEITQYSNLREMQLQSMQNEIEQVKIGCLAAEGIDYIALGKQTGKMAAKVLKGEAKASEQNFETITEPGFYVNNKVAENLGITVPDDLANNAVESFDEITAE